LVTGDCSLTREIIKKAQDKNPLCETYKTCEKFRLDGDQLLYHEIKEGCSFIVIPEAQVGTVLPFAAHQGIARPTAAIKRKYWWEFLSDDVKL
jgi:hypothetical protein